MTPHPPNSKADFEAAFAGLKKILAKFTARMNVARDTARAYHLETKNAAYKGRPLMFAGAVVNKGYVSYHLVPIYMNPALQKRLSPELKKRMQGKACFNFSKPDKALFAELAALTEAGFKSFKERGFLGDRA